MSRGARLGLFIFAALIILFAGIFLVGDNDLMFSPTFRIKAAFNNVSGLLTGAEVRVGGVRKGTVARIVVPDQPGEKVTVEIDLESSTRQVIKKDSVASIETEGLLGNKYMAISFGSREAETVGDGDTIESQPPLDFSDLIKKTNEIVDTTMTTMKNVEGAAVNLSSIASKINRGDGTIGALVNDRSVYNEASAAASNLRETAEQAKVGVTAFQENMQALKGNLLFRGFFRRRGFKDSTELTRYETPKLPDGPPLKKFVYEVRNLFERPDAAKLKNDELLDQAGRFLERTPFGEAVVLSSTGLEGEKTANLVLTRARATVVRQYLAENFRFDDSRVKTKGLGEDSSVADRAGKLEILVYPKSSKVETGRRRATTHPSEGS